MKTYFFVSLLSASVLVLPLSFVCGAEQAPPIAQPLVREGDFAVKLVENLAIGTAQDEAEAENMLASLGITPKNGWIADYPVTPDIIVELQTSILEAADSGRLAINRDEAIQIFQELTAEEGLYVVAGTQDGSDEQVNTYSYSGEYSSPAVISNYYETEGPPIITYYPPPWNYNYLYAWVPYPFWGCGFYFPGFFILNDFHRVVHHRHRHCVVTNHWRDPHTRRFHVIDPRTRHLGNRFGSHPGSHPRKFTSPEARKAGSSIIDQTRERMRNNPPVMSPGKGFPRKSSSSPGPGQRSGGQTYRAEKTRPYSQGREQTRLQSHASPLGNPHAQPGLQVRSERSFGRTPVIEGRSAMGGEGPSPGQVRSTPPSSGSPARSFSPRAMTGGSSGSSTRSNSGFPSWFGGFRM